MYIYVYIYVCMDVCIYIYIYIYIYILKRHCKEIEKSILHKRVMIIIYNNNIYIYINRYK